MSNTVKDGFDAAARSYDSQRKYLIPCFNDFYFHAVWAIPDTLSHPRVLDLGAGTGLVSGYVLARLPKARLTLVDMSESMLQQAQKRFGQTSSVTFMAADFLNDDIPGQFDVVISALSIHHLNNDEKKTLFARVYDLAAPGGVFINADQALGESQEMERRYSEEWKRYIEGGPLKHEEIEAAYARMAQDKTARISDQKSWLSSVGFTDVQCVYRYRNFAVLYAKREDQ